MAERANLALGVQTDSSAERSTDEIRRDIAATRDSIKGTVEQLNVRVEKALDWRTYVGQSPFLSLGAAAGCGYILSRAFRPRPTPRERFVDAIVETVEDFTGQVRQQLDRLPSRRMGAGQAMKAAATSLVTQAVVAYVRGRSTGDPRHSDSSSGGLLSGSKRQ
jgi:Protein of unknown function (DUF3618)